MAGWKTQLKERFSNTRSFVSSGSIEGSAGVTIQGSFYWVEYGTGVKGPKNRDTDLDGKSFIVFDSSPQSQKYYVPEPPFDGQDAG